MLVETDNLRKRKERLAAAIYEKRVRDARKLQSNPDGGLLEFIRHFWHVLEPATEFVDGWVVQCLCAHLEAITRGDTVNLGGEDRLFNRLLANVPPGFMKSLLVNVFWPAWEWGPRGMPHLRYVAFSYAAGLTERDNQKFRDLIVSRDYQELWGHVFKVVDDGKVRVTNDKTGFKFASSLGGIGTGERGDRVLCDDIHKVKASESDDARKSVVDWVREGMSNRLNSLARSVIVIIMQRTHEDDTSGAILKHYADEYCCLIVPMEYEPGRHFTSLDGWEDPREEEGELAWPERYGTRELASFRRNPYLWAGQYQQSPTPRGGGILKEAWWQVQEVIRDKDGRLTFATEVIPIFVLASLDTAFSENEENDYSALTVWVVYNHPKTKNRCIMLADAWQKRLTELSGPEIEQRSGESQGAYMRRAQESWGLCDWVAYTCKKQKVECLIVENKNRGHDVVKTIRRLHADRSWGVRTVEPKGDKWSRIHSIVDMFTDEMIYAPAEVSEEGDVRFLEWAAMAISECSRFPKGAHDDIPDTVSQALKFLRDNSYAIRRDEQKADDDARARMIGGKRDALYPA